MSQKDGLSEEKPRYTAEAADADAWDSTEGDNEVSKVAAGAAFDRAIQEKLRQIEITEARIRDASSAWEKKISAGWVSLDEVARQGTLMDSYYKRQKELKKELKEIEKERERAARSHRP